MRLHDLFAAPGRLAGFVWWPLRLHHIPASKLFPPGKSKPTDRLYSLTFF
jgi:hypothetical protein